MSGLESPHLLELLLRHHALHAPDENDKGQRVHDCLYDRGVERSGLSHVAGQACEFCPEKDRPKPNFGGGMSPHLGRTQLPKINKTLYFLLDRVGRGPATVAPQILAGVGHLEQAHADGPDDDVDGEQDVADVAGGAAGAVGFLDAAAEVGADGDGVEEEGDEGDG